MGCGVRLLGIAIVLAVVVVAVGGYRAKLFRKFPTEEAAVPIFSSELPHNIVARHAAFVPGGELYTATLRGWIYQDDRPELALGDTPWNRALLDQDIDRMTAEAAREHLPLYPLTPSALAVTRLAEVLDADTAGCKGKDRDCFQRFGVIRPLARASAGREVIAAWLQRELADKRSTELITTVAQHIVQVPSLATPNVIDQLLARFDVNDRPEFFRTVAMEIPTSRDLDGIARWFLESAQQGRITGLRDGLAAIAGRILMMPDHRDEVLRIIVEVARRGQPCDLDELFKPLRCAAGDGEACDGNYLEYPDSASVATSLATTLYESTVDRRADVASGALHALTHVQSVAALEEIAKPVLAGPDTELRKNIVVLLIRHGSGMGPQYLDDAFRGGAPRSERFHTVDDYIYGSRAAEEYRRLSGHDMKETGKRFPPAGSENDDMETVQAWGRFILEYPWFPSTDDAYYRKAYAQAANRDLAGARRTIETYATVAFPDNDVGTCMKRLARALDDAAGDQLPIPDKPECCLDDGGDCNFEADAERKQEGENSEDGENSDPPETRDDGTSG